MEFTTLTESVTRSRVHNKRIAPVGKIFLIAKIKEGKMTYTLAHLMETAGIGEAVYALVGKSMIKSIKEKYNLDGTDNV